MTKQSLNSLLADAQYLDKRYGAAHDAVMMLADSFAARQWISPEDILHFVKLDNYANYLAERYFAVVQRYHEAIVEQQQMREEILRYGKW